MRYYLRKYTFNEAQELSDFTLTLLVEDYDGVDEVTMMYSYKKGDLENITLRTQDIGFWQNVTMKHGTGNWYEATIPVSDLSVEFSWCSYLVKYAANDTLGNWEVSPLCTYVFANELLTADWDSSNLLETPDLWYVIGTTGHTVTWSELDPHGSMVGWPYRLYENGHLVERWSWPGSLTISVDGFELGDHIFELHLQVYASEDQSDTVVVHVVETEEDIPAGVSTDSVGPQTELDGTFPDPVILILVLGLSVALVIIWMKKRP